MARKLLTHKTKYCWRGRKINQTILKEIQWREITEIIIIIEKQQNATTYLYINCTIFKQALNFWEPFFLIQRVISIFNFNRQNWRFNEKKTDEMLLSQIHNVQYWTNPILQNILYIVIRNKQHRQIINLHVKAFYIFQNSCATKLFNSVTI